jgi:hypothetical protein
MGSEDQDRPGWKARSVFYLRVKIFGRVKHQEAEGIITYTKRKDIFSVYCDQYGQEAILRLIAMEGSRIRKHVVGLGPHQHFF